MKITFQNLEICAEDESPQNLKCSLKKLVQIENIIEAQSAFLSDKANTRIAISFEIERAYKSESAAQSAFLKR